MNKNFIKQYGYTEYFEKQIESLKIDIEEFEVARVVEVQKETYKIAVNNKTKYAKLKGSVFYNGKNVAYPAVGDFVVVKENPIGDDTIYLVLERKSKFSRLDTSAGIEQIVAVNFDYVFIMMSMNKDFNIKRLERYISVTWQSGGIPIIILTKADICEDIEYYISQIEKIAFGIPIIVISSFTGQGLEEINNYLKPEKTIIFLGSSGIGKSSLLNALAGEVIMGVNDIREDDSKGKHTTTYRHLSMLENGSIIIDTPGMRELGMWDVTEGVETTFSEVEELISQCKFSNCTHNSEPGCAIKNALNSGALQNSRWQNYLKLKKEAEHAARKQNKVLQSNAKAKYKELSKFQKEVHKLNKK